MSLDNTSSAEGFTWEKLQSWHAVMAGPRYLEFDGILSEVPDPEGINKLSQILSTIRSTKVEIKHVFLDQDGTLGPAYEGLSERDSQNITSLKNAGISPAILTNNATAKKLNQARDLNIPIFGHRSRRKPGFPAYTHPLEELDWDPKHTAMFGDTAAMDKPYLKGSCPSYFQLPISAKRTIINGWTEASLMPWKNLEAPTNDYHPRRADELLAGNFLVLPQKMSWGEASVKDEIKRRALRLLINAQAKRVIANHPNPITTDDLLSPNY